MIIERVVGTIIGGAIGDGWGRPYEGSVPRGPAAAPDELVVTDDTQLTLATCEAVVECGRVDPERIAGRFVAWFRAGRLHGLGASTFEGDLARDRPNRVSIATSWIPLLKTRGGPCVTSAGSPITTTRRTWAHWQWFGRFALLAWSPEFATKKSSRRSLGSSARS